jgi:hypothetical protein
MLRERAELPESTAWDERAVCHESAGDDERFTALYFGSLAMRVWLGGPRILGVRTGISLGREDLKWLRDASPKRYELNGSFIYVIKGDHNLSKIGVSANPNARLAQLRTASPFPIDFSYIAVTPGNGFDIEAAAHAALSRHRCNGEWFDVPPEMAVAAISGAAHKLGQPLQAITSEMVDQIMHIASSDTRSPPLEQSNWQRTFALTMLGLLAFVILLMAVAHAYADGRSVMFVKGMAYGIAEQCPKLQVDSAAVHMTDHISGNRTGDIYDFMDGKMFTSGLLKHGEVTCDSVCSIRPGTCYFVTNGEAAGR